MDYFVRADQVVDLVPRRLGAGGGEMLAEGLNSTSFIAARLKDAAEALQNHVENHTPDEDPALHYIANVLQDVGMVESYLSLLRGNSSRWAEVLTRYFPVQERFQEERDGGVHGRVGSNPLYSLFSLIDPEYEGEEIEETNLYFQERIEALEDELAREKDKNKTGRRQTAVSPLSDATNA